MLSSTGVWAYQREAPAPTAAVSISMWTDPLTGLVYANGINMGTFHGLVLDKDENWVVDMTPVTVTYDLTGIGGTIRLGETHPGRPHLGRSFAISHPGVVTFTARAS